jgi:hypothetical protein
MVFIAPANGQELLKATEPGTDYSVLKQWAIQHQLGFRDFAKNSLEIVGPLQENADSITYMIGIAAKFCTGHDYSGNAYETRLLQSVGTDTEKIPSTGVANFLPQIFQKHQQYIEALAGTPSQEGNFPGKYTLRRSHDTNDVGVAYGQGGWELGLFLGATYLSIQVVRSKDDLCK